MSIIMLCVLVYYVVVGGVVVVVDVSLFQVLYQLLILLLSNRT